MGGEEKARLSLRNPEVLWSEPTLFRSDVFSNALNSSTVYVLKPSLFLVLYFLSGNRKEVVLKEIN